MLKTITLTLEVHIENEWIEVPTHLKMDIDEQMFHRIVELSELVRKHNLVHVASSSYPEFFEIDYDSEKEGSLKKWEGSTECMKLVVSNDSFQWRGYIRNTNVMLSSDNYYIENLLVKMVPIDELPVLMESLTFDPAKDLLKKRLKEGK